MSFTSPREAAAADAARIQSKYSAQLADVSLPQLSSLISTLQKDVNPTGIAPSVSSAFDTARKGVTSDFAAAGKGQAFDISQSFKQSGMPYSSSNVDEATRGAAIAMNKEKTNAMQQLDFQEANAGMNQFNQLMNLLGAGEGAALNIGKGFSSVQNAAIGGLSNTSPGSGAVGGAASGAALGSEIYPGWGTVIGGVLGGVGGYFAGGG